MEGDGRPSDVDPQAWLLSLGEAAGGGLLEGVQAIGVSSQQNALVPLDSQGATVRPALVGGDKRAQVAAADLIDALGGRQAWAEAVGCVPQAARPVTKLRWLAKAEPDNARRASVLLQAHDWLVWQLLGRPVRRTTDRGGASGTGYWSAATGAYRPDLWTLALGHQAGLPEVLGPSEAAGTTPEGLLISAGTGETMAAALGLGIGLGDAVVSLGASGSVMAVHPEALVDSTGMITSLADATGMHLPVVTTLNAVRALRGTAELLGVPDLEGLSDLAMKSTPGSHGLVLLPYLEGERTPNLPHTAGTLAGLRRESMKPEHLARAAFEGMLCGLADGLDVLRGRGVEVRRIFLLGAAAELSAVQARRPRSSACRSWCPSRPTTRRSARPGRRLGPRRVAGDPGPAHPAGLAGRGRPGPGAGRRTGGGPGRAPAVRVRTGADASGGVPRLVRAPSYGSPGVVPVRVRPLRHLTQPRSVRGS